MQAHNKPEGSAILLRWAMWMAGERPVDVPQSSDLRSGVVLIKMVQKMFGKTLRDQYMLKPLDRDQCIQNVHTFVIFAKSCGLGISLEIEDIVDDKVDKVSEMLWMCARYHLLCLRLHHNMYTDTGMEALVVDKTMACIEQFGVVVTDCTGFEDGRALCALVCSYDRRALSFEQTEKLVPTDRLREALKAAEKKLSVPPIAMVQDLQSGKRGMLMYLGVFFDTACNEHMKTTEELHALRSRSIQDTEKISALEVELSEKDDIINVLTEEARAAKEEISALATKVEVGQSALQSARANVRKLELGNQQLAKEKEKVEVDRETKVMTMGDQLDQLQTEKDAMSSQLMDALNKGGAVTEQLKHLIRQVQFAAKDKEAARHLPNVDPPGGFVFFMFTDVENSTKLWEYDSDMMENSLAIHNSLIRSVVTEHKGYEVKTEGDAFMVVFQDGVDAVTCAMAIQTELLVCDWPVRLLEDKGFSDTVEEGGVVLHRGLRVRIGLHGGVPQCTPDPITGRMDYFGPVVNRASRVEGAASGGQTVISLEGWQHVEGIRENTAILDEDIGCFRFKGIKEEVFLHNLLPVALAGRTFERRDTRGDVKIQARVSELEHENERLQRRLYAMETELLDAEAFAVVSCIDAIRVRAGQDSLTATLELVKTAVDAELNGTATIDRLKATITTLTKDNHELQKLNEDFAKELGADKRRVSGSMPVTAVLDHLKEKNEAQESMDKLRTENRLLAAQLRDMRMRMGRPASVCSEDDNHSRTTLARSDSVAEIQRKRALTHRRQSEGDIAHVLQSVQQRRPAGRPPLAHHVDDHARHADISSASSPALAPLASLPPLELRNRRSHSSSYAHPLRRRQSSGKSLSKLSTDDTLHVQCNALLAHALGDVPPSTDQECRFTHPDKRLHCVLLLLEGTVQDLLGSSGDVRHRASTLVSCLKNRFANILNDAELAFLARKISQLAKSRMTSPHSASSR